MSGKKTRTRQEAVVSDNELSRRFLETQGNLSRIAGRAEQAYSDPLTASLVPRFGQAARLIDPLVGQGNLNRAAAGAAAGSRPIGQGEIDRYANPFADLINRTAQAQSDQSFAEEVNQSDAGLGARAFGTRAGINRAQAFGDKIRDDANRAAGIYRDSHNIGLDAAQADRGRQLQASGVFSGLAGQEQARQAQTFGQESALAGVEQLNAQSGLDREYQEFVRRITQPAGYYAQAAGLVPASGFVGSNTEATGKAGGLGAFSAITQGLGALASGAGAAGSGA